jgi:hypothetical protein
MPVRPVVKPTVDTEVGGEPNKDTPTASGGVINVKKSTGQYGTYYQVSGNTKEFKDIIKAHGGNFKNFGGKVWWNVSERKIADLKAALRNSGVEVRDI